MKPERLQRLGLIGRQIGYSLSPLIHNTSSQHLGIDAEYSLHDCASTEEVKFFLHNAWQNGSTGFNVTQTWKKIFGDHSINTLYRQPGATTWSMTSTDSEGFFAGARRIGCRRDKIRRVIFFGNGGAVDAIASLLDIPLHCIVRDPLRQTPVPGRTFHPWSPAEFRSLLTATTDDGTLIVQATPAPLSENSLSEFVPPLNALRGRPNNWFVDLCYSRVSALMEGARAAAIPSQDGLPMLIEQARSAQTIWWGKSAPYQLLESACLAAITGPRQG